MANRRSKNRSRRPLRRAPRRKANRNIRQALDLRPVRLRSIVNDPPVTIQHSEKSIRIPIRFLVDDTATGSGFIGAPGAAFDTPVYVCKYVTNTGGPDTVLLTIADISKCFGNITGMLTTDGTFGKRLDICIRKVIFWGPSVSSNITSPGSIEMSVDLGEFTTGCNLADIGTTTRRPAVGVRIPFTRWFEASNTDTNKIKLQWDSGNKDGTANFPKGRYEIGVAHITVTGRYSEY